MTTDGITVALSSTMGDPRREQTWSGTPFNLVKSLEDLGVSVVTIDASLSRKVRMVCKLVHLLGGLRCDTRGGPVARLIAAKVTNTHCRRAGVHKVLHIGTTEDLSGAGGSKMERYLFCDTTWNLFSSHATGRYMRRFSPRGIRAYEKLEVRAFAQIRHFFPISEYVKENLTGHYGIDPKAITVVGTGRGKIAPFGGAKDYAQGHILFVASNRFADKGGFLLLQGFQLAVKKNPSLKLVLAGGETEAAVAQNAPNVTVAGRVPWPELQRLFETAALFAMPAYNEPWGLVLLEALACRTPLLGLARNSFPELTQNGRFGFLVGEPEPRLIAEAILRAFADPKNLERMGSEGQKYCLDKFSWPRTAGLIRERLTR
jgi:glycosyltransferase involved in cell wall biosynthesis